MEVFDKDIQFLKDIWSDLDRREITKRVIAIALAEANPGIVLGDIVKMDAVLDDRLLEKEDEQRFASKDMTI